MTCNLHGLAELGHFDACLSPAVPVYRLTVRTQLTQTLTDTIALALLV